MVAGKDGSMASLFRESGARFHILPRRAPIDPVYIFKLWKISKRYDTHIIHAHQLPEALNAVFLSLFTGQKIFFTWHGYRYLEKYRLFRGLFLFVLRRLRANLFVSNTLREYYESTYPGKIRNGLTLYNGLLPNVARQCDRQSFRMQFGIPEDALLLGMTANFSEARDHMLVVKAIATIVSEAAGSNTPHLILVGSKDGEGSIFRQASEYVRASGLERFVHFAGSMPDAGALAACYDIFVYASHRETFSLSVVEAIMAGVPVIVNDLAVMREITLDGTLAHLYTTGSESDLVSKIKEVSSNLSDSRSRASLSSARASELYGIERHIEKLLEIYRKLT